MACYIENTSSLLVKNSAAEHHAHEGEPCTRVGGFDLASQLARLEQQHELQLRMLAENLDLMRKCLRIVQDPKTIGNVASNQSVCTQASQTTPPVSPSPPQEVNNRRTSGQTQVLMDGVTTTLWANRKRKASWRFLEDPTSSMYAKAYLCCVLVLISAGIWNFWMDVFLHRTANLALTLVTQLFFVVEWVVRCVVCPSQHLFWTSAYTWLDIITTLLTLSMVLAIVVANLDVDTATILHAYCPLLLMLKLCRRFRMLHLLLSALSEAAEALPVLLFTLFLIGLTYSSLIFMVEPRSNITSFSDAAWFVVVTLGTVGYGDLSPVTSSGRMLTTALIITGGLYTAIPIGMVGSAFTKVWEDRERLMLLRHIREYITWAGFTVSDVSSMFEALDENGDHELSFDEFTEILPLVEVELDQEVAQKVFRLFDKDAQGSIDVHEFLCVLFPMHRFFLAQTWRKPVPSTLVTVDSSEFVT